MLLNRRQFVVSSGAAGVLAAVAEKTVDGGLVEVTDPGVPDRVSHVIPPGAKSQVAFSLRCTGCQLCVSSCPNKVLRPSVKLSRFAQPEMGYNLGWCRPECTVCGDVCPAGAIRPISVQEKANIHIGHAVWHQDRCLAAKEGITCTSCERHCPAKAISLVELKPGTKNSPKVPVVDAKRCLGCGACEYLCPSRPLPGITVEGLEKHVEIKPMGDEDVVKEAMSLFDAGKAAVLVVKDGVFKVSENGRGIAPLLEIFDKSQETLQDSWVIDKVIGRAAAAICVVAGVKRVHAAMIGADAGVFLKEHGIPCTAGKTVPRILNRQLSGPCPLELSVEGLSDPMKMLEAIRHKLAELRKAARK